MCLFILPEHPSGKFNLKDLDRADFVAGRIGQNIQFSGFRLIISYKYVGFHVGRTLNC
jgi:hypothetical protein